MSYAVAHSLDVGDQSLKNSNLSNNAQQAALDLLPSVGANTYAYNTYGRNIDPETNTYSMSQYFYNSYSASASMPLFAGLSNINTYRAARVANMAGRERYKQICDQTALSTMQAYFEVLYYTESVHYCTEQLATSRRLLEQNRKYLEIGTKSAADVAQIEVQAASDDYTLTEQQNLLEQSQLKLKQTMNWPLDTPLDIVTEVEVEAVAYQGDLAEVVDNALSNNPKARAAQLDLRNSQLSLSVARGRLYPSLNLYGSYSTNYIRNMSTQAAEVSPFRTQLRNNEGFSVQASLSIPIFSGLSRRKDVSRARNNLQIAQNSTQRTLNELQVEILNTAQQMQGFGKQYVQAAKKVEAARLAYNAAQQRFAQGTMSPVDLQTTANQLLQALSERLNCRLQYIIKCRLMAYYNGEPLIEPTDQQ